MATISKGTVLKFTPAEGVETVVGRLTSIGEITADASEIDVTTLDSPGGYREIMQGWRDAGILEISGYHFKDDAGQAGFAPPMNPAPPDKLSSRFQTAAPSALKLL